MLFLCMYPCHPQNTSKRSLIRESEIKRNREKNSPSGKTNLKIKCRKVLWDSIRVVVGVAQHLCVCDDGGGGGC